MRELISSLARLLGNKRYIYDLEKILARLDLKPEERHTLQLLTQDLNQIKRSLESAQSKAKQPWKTW